MFRLIEPSYLNYVVLSAMQHNSSGTITYLRGLVGGDN